MKLEWAGVPFLAVHHHDGRFFRLPGLFGLVARRGEERTLLFVGEGDNIAEACQGSRVWPDALALGLNELNIALHAVERIDRLLLRGHIVKRCEPLLNVLDEAAGSDAVGSQQSRSRLR